jgi:hypothetical protein
MTSANAIPTGNDGTIQVAVHGRATHRSGGASWAYASPLLVHWGAEPGMTSNQAPLFAALSFLREFSLDVSEVVIVTNSEYVAGALRRMKSMRVTGWAEGEAPQV